MPVIHEDGNYLTEKGRALIAKLMASKSEIQFTRAAVGAGTIPEGMAPKDMTDLSDWRADGLISDISTPVPGEVGVPGVQPRCTGWVPGLRGSCLGDGPR